MNTLLVPVMERGLGLVDLRCSSFLACISKSVYTFFTNLCRQCLDSNNLSVFCFQLIVSNGCTPLVDTLAYALADEGGMYKTSLHF